MLALPDRQLADGTVRVRLAMVGEYPDRAWRSEKIPIGVPIAAPSPYGQSGRMQLVTSSPSPLISHEQKPPPRHGFGSQADVPPGVKLVSIAAQ